MLEQIRSAQQQQQKVEQMQLAMQMLTMKLGQAKTILDVASAKEKIAKSEMNRAIASDEHMQAVKKMGQMETQQLKDLMELVEKMEVWMSGEKSAAPEQNLPVGRQGTVAEGGESTNPRYETNVLSGVLNQHTRDTGLPTVLQSSRPNVVQMPGLTPGGRKRVGRTKR